MQQFAPFHRLPASHVLALVQRAEPVHLKAGEAVSVAGQAASALLILRDGEIKADDAAYQGKHISCKVI